MSVRARAAAAVAAAVCVLPLFAHADTANERLVALYMQLITLLTEQLKELRAAQVAGVAQALPAAASATLTLGDPGQPAPSLAPQAAGVLFLQFDLTAGDADVAVRKVVIAESGPGSNGAFSSFGLFDSRSLQIGPVATLDATHRITFRTPFIVRAHATEHVQLYANMQSDLSAYDGQRPAFSLVGIDASTPISGALPLMGNPQTINANLTVGSATALLSQFDPGADNRRYIGDTGVRFSGIRLTADSHEDLSLSQIIWTQSGTAGPGDISNVQTVVRGTSYPTFRSPYEPSAYVTNFDPAIVIPKGDSADVYVQGDILPSAANRTVAFDIWDNTDDISLTGSTYGFAVGAAPGGNTDTSGHSVFLTSDGTTNGTSLSPFFAGSRATIIGSSVIIGR